jgi:hypothetical protein
MGLDFFRRAVELEIKCLPPGKGRQRAKWERTALLAAIGANPYRNPQKRPKPFEPREFNPFAERLPKVEKTKIKISVECLKPLCREEQGN